MSDEAAAAAAKAVADADAAGVARATALFSKTYDGARPTAAAAAPGRVNLIGEHTDYNDGWVFPLALEKSTYMVGARRSGGAGTKSRVVCEAFEGDVVEFDVAGDVAPLSGDRKWANYVVGMVAMYVRAAEKSGGEGIPAFDAAFVSDVPIGGGVSSSAALEMSTGAFLEALTSCPVDATERALRGQATEHEYAKVPCGIMDQLISSRATAGSALLIDCRSHDVAPVPLSDPSVVIVVTNSHVEHDLSGSEYPERRESCTAAVKAIAAKHASEEKPVKALRDATLGMLASVSDDLDPKTRARAHHVISEDVRTQEARKALEAGDFTTVGRLMVESHASLRDDYEVSVPEIDALVEIACKVDGVFGSRITGGGFGGCTVSLAKREAVDALLAAVEAEYPAASGGVKATCFVTRAGAGARQLEVPAEG